MERVEEKSLLLTNAVEDSVDSLAIRDLVDLEQTQRVSISCYHSLILPASRTYLDLQSTLLAADNDDLRAILARELGLLESRSRSDDSRAEVGRKLAEVLSGTSSCSRDDDDLRGRGEEEEISVREPKMEGARHGDSRRLS